jgi:hypothetical protein
MGRYDILMDPRLPDWIGDSISRTLPLFLNHYSTQTGIAYDKRPYIFLSYFHGSSGYGTRGAVLPRQMRLALFGSEWNSETAENHEKLLGLLAHETAHFWNGDKFMSSGGERDAWMHEGGADAFAARAVVQLKISSKETFLKNQVDALNRCILGLSGTSLQDSGRLQRYENYYNCGSIMGLITEAAVATSGMEWNLFRFWGAVFARAAGTGGFYSPDSYFAQVAQFNPEVAHALATFASARIADPSEFLSTLMKKVGLQVSATGDQAPSWYRAQMSRQLAQVIAQQDCGTPTVSAYSDTYRIEGPDCRAFNGQVLLLGVGYHHVWNDAIAAYDEAFNQCQSRGSITVHTYPDYGSLVIPCREFPRPPRYLTLRDYPYL